MNNISALKNFFYKYGELVLFIITTIISFTAIIYFYQHNNQNLANYDAIARLNISRRIIDSITPGVGQLGGIWLPFPQILFLPFIWIDFFWHTGTAGSIISAVAFIYSALFLYKTALLITKNISCALLVWLMFVSNTNILLLQTMALSESFFFFCLIMILYYLTKWVISHDILTLLITGFFVTLITLTRYEGYFVFIGALLTVLVECIKTYKNEGKSKIEGMVLLFLTVAGFGIILWCIYCGLFYKDPLYWLHAYSTTSVVAPPGAQTTKHTSTDIQTPFSTSLNIYSHAIAWTNGIIIVILSTLGILLTLYSIVKKARDKKSISEYLPILSITILVFIFLIYGYHIGFIPHITFPPKLLRYPSISSFSRYEDTNIRYGIIMAPLIILFAGFASLKNKIFTYVVLLCIVFQVFMNFYKPQSLQYSFMYAWQFPMYEETSWFTSHYDNGLILISANKHEDFMFQTNLPFKDFIYEGTRDYWNISLNNPAKYAKWVIYNDVIMEDNVSDHLTPNAHFILQKKFQLVYDKNGYKIYHIIQN